MDAKPMRRNMPPSQMAGASAPGPPERAQTVPVVISLVSTTSAKAATNGATAATPAGTTSPLEDLSALVLSLLGESGENIDLRVVKTKSIAALKANPNRAKVMALLGDEAALEGLNEMEDATVFYIPDDKVFQRV